MRAQLMELTAPRRYSPLEFEVVEQLLDDALTVVEGAANGNVVHVRVQHRGHLPLLDRRDAALGMENEDVDARLAPYPRDGGRARVPRGRPENVQPAAVALQQVLEHVAQKLQGDILEGRRRTVEELEDGLRADPHHRRDLGVGEGRVGALDQIGEIVAGHGIRREGGHDLDGEVLESQSRQSAEARIV